MKTCHGSAWNTEICCFSFNQSILTISHTPFKQFVVGVPGLSHDSMQLFFIYKIFIENFSQSYTILQKYKGFKHSAEKEQRPLNTMQLFFFFVFTGNEVQISNTRTPYSHRSLRLFFQVWNWSQDNKFSKTLLTWSLQKALVHVFYQTVCQRTARSTTATGQSKTQN